MNQLAIIKRRMFDLNVGFMDRQVRVVIGSGLLAAVLLNPPETIGNLSFLILATIPVISSGILGWDPFYALFGKSSYVANEEDILQRDWSYSNIGILDRCIRLGVGIVLLSNILLVNATAVDAVTALFAIPFITTALMAWDPLYAIVGINSFAARIDAEAAEPGANEQTLAKYYTFPEKRNQPQELQSVAKAA